MTGSMTGQTYHVNWEEWLDFCSNFGLDHREYDEHSIDLGGGDYITVKLNDDRPEGNEEEE